MAMENESKLNDFFQLGRYTFLMTLLLFLMLINQIGIMIFMTFAGVAPKIISCGNNDFSNASDIMESCQMLNEAQKRENCTPKFSAQFISINQEWGYYCEKTKIVKRSITFQMFGLMIGAIVFGQISDIFGRKPTLLVAITLSNIFNVATSFTSSLFYFSIMNFLVNIFNAGSFAVLPIFSLEFLPPKDRLWIIIYGVLAYFCADWRTLARTTSSIVIPAILLCCYLDESPRFLIQKGRIANAKFVLKRIHRLDGRHFDEQLVDFVLDKENQMFLEKQAKKKNYSMLHLFYTPALTRYAFSIALSFFTTSIVVFALTFNMESISGSIYTNLIISGLIRYGIGAIIAFCEIKCPRFGRKSIHFLLLFLTATCLFSFFAIQITGYQSIFALLLRIVPLLILGFISQTYFLNGICTTELFPTSIRNLAYSFGALFNRFGITCAPQVFFLADLWKPLPYLFMFLLVVFDMLFFQFNTKETKNNPMSDHMPGKDEWWPCLREKKSSTTVDIQNFVEKEQKLLENDNH